MTVAPCDGLNLSVAVSNTGAMLSAETVQVYVSWKSPTVPTAQIQLVAFEKILLAPGEKKTVALRVEPRELAVLHNASTTHSEYLDDDYNETEPVPPTWVVEPLGLNVWVGGQQPSQPVSAPSNVLAADVHIVGDMTPVVACLGDNPSTLPY